VQYEAGYSTQTLGESCTTPPDPSSPDPGLAPHLIEGCCICRFSTICCSATLLLCNPLAACKHQQDTGQMEVIDSPKALLFQASTAIDKQQETYGTSEPWALRRK